MASLAQTPANNLTSVVFYLAMAMLFTHELDAMTNHEWRVLPLTSWLADATGRQVFVLAHIPLFGVLIALVASLNQTVRQRARWLICAFALLHGIVHLLFSSHSEYEFSSATSHLLIFGGALFGALYLALVWLFTADTRPPAARR
jgi:hypothetical protein